MMVRVRVRVRAGELRSIGSVMINTDADGNKSILNADEFQRLMTVKAPPETGNEAANIDWARSRERLFQVSGCACAKKRCYTGRV